MKALLDSDTSVVGVASGPAALRLSLLALASESGSHLLVAANGGDALRLQGQLVVTFSTLMSIPYPPF